MDRPHPRSMLPFLLIVATRIYSMNLSDNALNVSALLGMRLVGCVVRQEGA